MTRVWHIVAKDARRFWPAAVLWAALFTAHLFSDWRMAQAATNDAETRAELKFFELLLFVVQLLVSYVVAATVVLEDSPVGTATFWPTRPIAGGRLLVAKLGICFGWFIVLAMLLSLPWWTFSALKPRDLGSGALGLFRWQAWVVGTAVVVAAFAGSLGKFLGWTLGLTLGLIAAVLLLSGRRGVTIEPQSWLLLPALAALWILYHLRKKPAALALLAVSAIAAVALTIRPAV